MNEGSKAPRILIVEDDRALREGLALNFRVRGWEPIPAADGEAGIRKAFDERPDAIVLDLVLPGWNGLEILKELRDRQDDVPVLILSARGRLEDKVKGLELGADDYLPKPFQLPELLARVEALLRRRKGRGAWESPIRFGAVELDPQSRSLRVSGSEVVVSTKEFDLLLLLARSPGRPFTREAILAKVWGWDFDGTARTVDNFVLSLRQKIEPDPAQPRHLKTVRGVGYRLDF